MSSTNEVDFSTAKCVCKETNTRMMHVFAVFGVYQNRYHKNKHTTSFKPVVCLDDLLFCVFLREGTAPKEIFVHGQPFEFWLGHRGRIISAPTRAPEFPGSICIKQLRDSGFSARADVGADIIRPRHSRTQNRRECPFWGSLRQTRLISG